MNEFNEQLHRMLDLYASSGILDGEQLMYIYYAINETNDEGAREYFKDFAATVAREYARKKDIEIRVLRENFIRS